MAGGPDEGSKVDEVGLGRLFQPLPLADGWNGPFGRVKEALETGHLGSRHQQGKERTAVGSL